MTTFAEAAKAAKTSQDHHRAAEMRQKTAERAEKCLRAIQVRCRKLGIEEPVSAVYLISRGDLGPHSTYYWEVPVDGYDDVAVRLSHGWDAVTYTLRFPNLGNNLGHSDGDSRYVEFKTMAEAGAILAKIDEARA